jgi:hypothetical protein
MSAVRKLRSILALHPETASSDVLYGGTLGYSTRCSLMLPTVLAAQISVWRLADGPGGAAIHSRVAVVSA